MTDPEIFDTFISYSKKDQPFAFSLRSALEDEGLHVWIDERGIQPGDDWWSTIEAAIKAAQTFVVILSANSRDSDWVAREILLAESTKKPLFPVLAEGEGWARFANIQYIDMRKGVKGDAVKRLSERIKTKISLHVSKKTKDIKPVTKERFFLLSLKDNRSCWKMTERFILVAGFIVTVLALLVAVVDSCEALGLCPQPTVAFTATITPTPSQTPAETLTQTLTNTASSTNTDTPTSTLDASTPTVTFTAPPSFELNSQTLKTWQQTSGFNTHDDLDILAQRHAENLAILDLITLTKRSLCFAFDPQDIDMSLEQVAKKQKRFNGDITTLIIGGKGSLTSTDLETLLNQVKNPNYLYDSVGTGWSEALGLRFAVVLLGIPDSANPDVPDCAQIFHESAD